MTTDMPQASALKPLIRSSSFFWLDFPSFCIEKCTSSKTEKYQLVILFGRVKHLEASVNLFNGVKAFFVQSQA